VIHLAVGGKGYNSAAANNAAALLIAKAFNGGLI
jgi:hypothetical protein